MPEEMSGEFIDWLRLSQYRKTLEVCGRTAKSANEISRLTNTNPKDTAENLKFLERHKIIGYTPEGWKATEMGIKIKRRMKWKDLWWEFLNAITPGHGV